MIHLKTIFLALVLYISVSNGKSLPFIKPLLKCQKKIDLALVIDVSRNISKPDFERKKQFVIDSIDFLDIGVDKTRVAAVTFSNYVFPQFSFGRYSTKEEIKDALGRITFSTKREASRTYKALQYTYEEMFKTGNGERGDAMDVVVVLTDGVTNPGTCGSYDFLTEKRERKQTQIEAAKIKKMPAYIFAIGIGNETNTTELNGISSDPDTKFTFQVPTFADLHKDDIKKMLVETKCHCTTTIADVFFVLDESASIHTEPNFQKEINFTISVVELLNVGPGKSQVGAISFGEEANVMFNLNEAKTRKEVAKKLHQITWGAAKQTNLDKAFELLRKQGLNPRYGSRSNVPQIAVIITDGVSSNSYKTKEELKILHQQNYILFAIGVGPKRNDAELELIANNPDHVFRVDNNEALSSIKQSLAFRLCDQGITPATLAKKLEKPKQRKYMF